MVSDDVRSVHISASRNEAIDRLRGFVMIVMALDHVRDFVGNPLADLTNLITTTPALFITRWVTHICAPVFVFLAGTSAFLSATKATKAEAAMSLIKRGLWLVVLELTVVRIGWDFNALSPTFYLQVIWAIGISMVGLGALVAAGSSASRVPLALGLAIVLGHNLFDGVHPQALGKLDWIWGILHEQMNLHPVTQVNVIVFYPVLPWFGLMLLGWSFGNVVQKPRDERRRLALRIGGSALGLYAILRGTGLYGDSFMWDPHALGANAILSFMNVHKYPPSLQYILEMMGIALLLLVAFDRERTPFDKPLLAFGRVPLFYYVIHLYLIHIVAIFALWLRDGRWNVWLNLESGTANWSLPAIYATWISVVIALYVPCRWFANYKARTKTWWIRYL